MPERRPRRDSSGNGRVPFVWVTDDSTGHRYDVPQNAIRPGMTPVEGYELNYTKNARRTKYRTDLANEPAVPTPVEQPSGDPVVAAQPAVGSGEPSPEITATKPTVKRAPGN